MQQANAGLATSLVFHALAAVALSRMAWHVALPPEPARPAVVWFGAWADETTTGAQDGSDSVDAEQAVPTEGHATSAPLSPLPAPATAPDPLAPLPAPAPPEPRTAAPAQQSGGAGIVLDWSERRRKAIDDVLAERERAASYQSFSFPGTLDAEQAFDEAQAQQRSEAGLAPLRTVFDSPAKGRAGLSETTPLGEQIVWVTDECYAKYGTGNGFLLPSAAGLYNVPMTTCLRVKPRDDLFANAKPRYLMSAEEHAERAQRLVRMATAVGAVATFDN